MKTLVTFIFAWILVGLCSCKLNPIQPTSAKPSVAMPTNWIGGARDVGSPISNWWQQFGSVELSGLVAEAEKQNPDMQMAAHRIEIADLQEKVARAGRLPTLDATMAAHRNRMNFVGFPFPGGSISTTHSLNFSSVWELDLWNRIRAGVTSATAEAGAMRADVAAARHSLIAQVVKAWLELTEAQNQIGLAMANVQLIESTAERTKTRYERGIGSSLDYRLALANVQQANAMVEVWRGAMAAARRRVEVLLGRYPEGKLSGLDALPAMPGAVPAGLPSELLERRPDIVSRQFRLLSSDARITQVRADLFPRISLTASGGTTSEELTGLIDTSARVWSLGGNLAAPLFNSGRLKAVVEQARGQAKLAMLEYQKTVLLAFGEVERSLSIEGHLRERESRIAAAIVESEAALKLAEERYSQGLEPFLVVIEAQRRLLDSRRERVSVRRQQLDNRVDLHLALGGNFDSQATKEKKK